MDIAAQVLSNLVTFIGFASLKSTVLVALVLLAHRLLGRFLAANGRYLLWLAVVISLVTPVGFNTALPSWFRNDVTTTVAAPVAQPASENTIRLETVRQIPGGARSAANPDSLLPPDYIDNDAALPITSAVSWLALLPYLWLTGALIVLGLVAAASCRFSVLVRHATPAPENLRTLLQDCLAQTACKAELRLLHSADIQVPMVAGLFKPVLLLPAGIEQRLTREQLRHVFIHELMHLKRLDIASNWLIVLVQALHWFNPAVWIAFSCMRHDRELACDAATLSHLDPADSTAYGHTLLQLSEALPRTFMPANALAMLESQAQLRRRILMLVQASRSGGLHATVTTLLFLPLAAVAFSQPAPAPDNASRPQEAQAPIVVALLEPVAVPAQTAATMPIPVTSAVPSAVPVTIPAAPATDADDAIPLIQQRPVNEARPVIQHVQAIDSAVAAAAPLAQLDTPAVADAFAPEAGAGSIVAAIDATQQPASPAEPYAEMSVIQQLGEEINAIKDEKIGFIEEWDNIAAECETHSNSVFGSLTRPCRKTWKALLRGEIFQFGYECHVLNYLQSQLSTRYREAAAQQQPGLTGVDAALRENELNLAAFCSKDTYNNDYQAFATLFAKAESGKYNRAGASVPGATGFYSGYYDNSMTNGAYSSAGGEYSGNTQPCFCESASAPATTGPEAPSP